jgi:hypothetical protein
MRIEEISVVAAIIVALLVIGKFLGKKPMPPDKDFRCARCGVVEAYTPRTIEAWRKGVKRLYCRECHKRWLNTQPRAEQSPIMRSRRVPSGCAIVLLVFIGIMSTSVYSIVQIFFA